MMDGIVSIILCVIFCYFGICIVSTFDYSDVLLLSKVTKLRIFTGGDRSAHGRDIGRGPTGSLQAADP